MSAIVTLDASPKKQQHGNPITFFGMVTYDGEPMAGLNVQVLCVETAALLADLWTDDQGYYQGTWTPTEDWIGSFSVHTFAAMYQGFYSEPVPITVTLEPVVSLSKLLLTIPPLLVGVALVYIPGRKF